MSNLCFVNTIDFEICFQVQFRVLVVTYKSIHGMGAMIFEESPFVDYVNLSYRSGRTGMFWVPADKDNHLAGPKRRTLSIVVLSNWDIILGRSNYP